MTNKPARRFTPRLRLALFLPTLMALLVAMPVLWVLANGLIRESARSHLDTTWTLAAHGLEGALDLPDEELNQRVHELVAGSDARLTVVAEDGRVLADSERDFRQVMAMDNHATRPEIVGARTNGYGSAVRRSETLNRDFLYVARPIDHQGGSAKYLRLAEPLATSRALRQRLTLFVFLASLAALGAMGLISLWLDRELFKPLSRLVEGADRLATGDLDSRVEVPDSEEIGTLARTLNQLASGIQRQIESVAAHSERLELITNSMADAILVTDSRARVLAVNPALRRLFRVRGDVEGRSVREVTGLGTIKKSLKRTLETASTQSLEVELRGSRPRTLSVTCSALEDRSGGIVAIRDITEFRLLGEIRRDLVANVSHELKTPLTAIRGYAETLADGALDDRQTSEHFTERILQQCARLQALLDDLLTLSRLEQDDGGLPLKPVDLKPIVEEAAEILQATAQSRKVEIRLELESAEVTGDPQALSEICLNLMENAVKYNRPDGQVTVELSSAQGFVELSIGDTGQGIPRDALARIFERFYRVDRGRSRSEGGTGLGLSIVKHAVERHGGTISVESALGEGSTFLVRLPVSPPGPEGST